MNPKYTEARKDRAKKLANKWGDIIGNKLVQKHEDVAIKNFDQYV